MYYQYDTTQPLNEVKIIIPRLKKPSMDGEETSQKRLNRVDRLFDTLGEQQLTISHHVRFSLPNNVIIVLIHLDLVS